jgi:uncharacterized BrkB/YihY/UPF0761 family membrane protein
LSVTRRHGRRSGFSTRVLVLIGMVVLLLVFVVALAMTVASHAHL